MASGAAPICGASQPAISASANGGFSQAPSGASQVEHAQELRRALNGNLYTMAEFREFYQQEWWWYWEQAVREAASPGAASSRGVSSSDACVPGGEVMTVELGQERQEATEELGPQPGTGATKWSGRRHCLAEQRECPVCHGPPDLTSSDVPCPKCRGLTIDSADAPVSFGSQLDSLLDLEGFSDRLVLRFALLDASRLPYHLP